MHPEEFEDITLSFLQRGLSAGRQYGNEKRRHPFVTTFGRAASVCRPMATRPVIETLVTHHQKKEQEVFMQHALRSALMYMIVGNKEAYNVFVDILSTTEFRNKALSHLVEGKAHRSHPAMMSGAKWNLPQAAAILNNNDLPRIKRLHQIIQTFQPA